MIKRDISCFMHSYNIYITMHKTRYMGNNPLYNNVSTLIIT
ncbi:hypothetical protein FM106_31125 [Brachybacterium faecium]|nr:hypothetical protein FM106_31125 [Brachybacterium faecium]